MKTKDKTVVHNLGLEACGGGANMVAADVLDGKLVRIRPMRFDGDYTKEELADLRARHEDADAEFPPDLQASHLLGESHPVSDEARRLGSRWKPQYPESRHIQIRSHQLGRGL